MKSTILYSLPFVIAVLVAGCAPAGDTSEQMLAEAKALDQRFFEAYNSKNVDAVMAMYWNNAGVISYPPGAMETRGWDNIKQDFTKEFGSMKDAKLELLESNNIVAGDHVIGYGKWRWTNPTPAMEMVGRYTDVKAKKDGKWVYIHDHASAPLPPPPDEHAAK